jgi:NADH-quinone oxidoreductase subunit C
VVCRVEPPSIEDVLTALREAGFDMLVDLFGTDTGDDIELTYHLRSIARDEDLYVRVGVSYDGSVGSVWAIYPSALYPEREAAELLGVSFAGHPNPKRLLTCDDVEVHLLRKSVAIRTPEEVRRDV